MKRRQLCQVLLWSAALIGAVGILASGLSLLTIVREPVDPMEVIWPEAQSLTRLLNNPTMQFHTAIVVDERAYTYYGVWLPIVGDNVRVLVVLVPAPTSQVLMPNDGASEGGGTTRPGAPPPMRVGLSSLVESRFRFQISGTVFPYGYGDPPIFCDLDQTQANDVLAHGVPIELSAELCHVADRVRWRPLDPNDMPPMLRHYIAVDAEPFFEDVIEGTQER